MAAIPIAGQNGTALSTITTQTVREIIRTPAAVAANFDGDSRVFELLGLEATNTSTTLVATLVLWDADQSTAVGTNAKVGADIRIAPGDTVKMEWRRGTGLKFRTNISASLRAGTMGVGRISAHGLLH